MTKLGLASYEAAVRERYNGPVQGSDRPGSLLKALNDRYFLKSEDLFYQAIDASWKRYRDAPVGELSKIALSTDTPQIHAGPLGCDRVAVSVHGERSRWTMDYGIVDHVDFEIVRKDVARITQFLSDFVAEDDITITDRLDTLQADEQAWHTRHP